MQLFSLNEWDRKMFAIAIKMFKRTNEQRNFIPHKYRYRENNNYYDEKEGRSCEICGRGLRTGIKYCYEHKGYQKKKRRNSFPKRRNTQFRSGTGRLLKAAGVIPRNI